MTTVPETLSEAVSAFVRKWFQELSDHVPVERLQRFLAPAGLQMVFPERTLLSLGDFRDWYATVGLAYTDQSHAVETVTATPADDHVDIDVVVIWRAVQTADGSRLAMRARQRWHLLRVPGDPGFVIAGYRVEDMTDL